MSEQNNQNTQESQTPHKRRVRYKVTAGEIQGHNRTCNPEGKYSCRNAHFHHGK